MLTTIPKPGVGLGVRNWYTYLHGDIGTVKPFGESKLPTPTEKWESIWMSPAPFRLKVGQLPDFSVGPADEIALRHSRLNAVVRVGLPDWFTSEDEVGLANFVDAHLRGRNPMTGSYSEGLLISFKVFEDNEASQSLAEDFAEALAADEVLGVAAYRGMVTGIARTDTSAIEHLLPEDMKTIR